MLITNATTKLMQTV